MNKNIWIVDEYAGSIKHGMTYRCYYLAKEFAKMGMEVSVIGGAYSHYRNINPNLENKNHKIEYIDGIRYCWLKTLEYKNSNDKKRVLKWFLFIFKLLRLPKILKDKPDFIISSTPALLSAMGGYFLSKRYKATFVFEVRDIWPLSLVELGGMSPHHPFVKLLSFVEKFAIKKCDLLVSNLPNYGLHVKELGIDKDYTWISNGVDLDELKQISDIGDDVKNLIPKDKFIVGYAGTIGEANAIESFLKSMEFLDDNFVFVLVGDGKYKEDLKQKYEKKSNIIFLPYIPKKKIQSMLNLFNVCYVGLKNKKIFRFGVSPTKIFDYMYSKKPILYAIDSGEINVIKTANAGICTKAQDPKEISKGIKKLFELSQKEREEMGKNARRYVVKHFTYDVLAKRYFDAMLNTQKKKESH